MCGIAGIARRDAGGISPETLLRMAAALRHRGPDGYGFLADQRIGLAHTRLRILDLARGDQPLSNEDGRYWITFNGEVFNWRALRVELQQDHHVFRTDTDTEVIVHAWEAWGARMLGRFNGQFAFAIYDRLEQSLFLARDRFGICPLFYAAAGGDFSFASEAKALFAAGVPAEPDPAGLAEAFTFWSARAPRTVFSGVCQIEPGGWARWRDGRLATGRWFEPDFTEADREPADALEVLDRVLTSAVATRMRADVPVGAYLSGGLDSSITSVLASRETSQALRTFSVAFPDPALDERAHQEQVARAIGSRHAMREIGAHDIGEVFPDVVRHAETPLLRTAAAPLFLLSRMAREQGVSVVLTGEGSDEMFLGYDLFKEAEVRRFCLRQPGSRLRPRLLDRIYPRMAGRGGSAPGAMWRRFFLDASTDTADPLFSHQPRFQLASFARSFFVPELRAAFDQARVTEALRATVPASCAAWPTTARAAWLEMTTLLSGYLLASQGDRMLMAHGVEGRFPFLDHRLFAFAAALPARSKLRGLRDKAILRRWARDVVPESIRVRPKQPYRAPDAAGLFGGHDRKATPVIEALLTPEHLRRSGLFDGASVAGLLRRCRAGAPLGVREDQALVGIISTLLWQAEFCDTARVPAPLTAASAAVRVYGANRRLAPQGV